VESSICPACDGDLYIAGYGCPECGHGRTRAASRNPVPIAAGAALGVVAVGVLLLVTAGTVSRHAAWAHGMLFVMSAIFAGGGAHALARPQGIPLARPDGTDASGMTRYGDTRPSTKKEGLVHGAVLLVVGIVMMLLGAFFGSFAG
jgi:hypothetical protein